MTQLHVDVTDETAEAVARRAESLGVSVEEYLADVVKRELALGWPEGFFERIVGGWVGEDFERPPQGEYEVREPLD